MPLLMKSKPVGPFAMNCYIVGCGVTRHGAVIDAGDDFDWIRATVRDIGLDVRWLLQTHAHLDHVGALAAAKACWPQAQICIHRDEMELYRNVPMQGRMFGLPVDPLPPPDRFIAEGDTLEVGELRVDVIETPGHTPGGVSFIVEEANLIFTGDALFAGSIGRTDLPGGDYRRLVDTLGRLRELPGQLRVLSGHGPETTIAHERRSNPFILQEFGAG